MNINERTLVGKPSVSAVGC